jgi:hypothetical protein
MCNDVTYHKVKGIMEGHLERNPGLLDAPKGKDIVVFLGNTGAGKSTTINYLCQKGLLADDFNNIVLQDQDDPSAFPIGQLGDSETFLPKFMPMGDLLFYDLPGFRETRGTALSLVNACFTKSIIENARSVRFLFVAGIGQITEDRGASFKKLVSQVRQLVPNKAIENLSGLVITKSTVSDKVLPDFLKAKLDLSHPDLSLINHWLNHQKVQQISLPRDGQIDYKSRESILNLIREMGNDHIERIDIGVIYDADQQKEIKAIYDAEMDDMIDRVMGENGCGLNLLSGHTLRFMGESPTPDALRLIQPGELGIFCTGGGLYGKAHDRETIEINGLSQASFERIMRSLKDPFNLEPLNIVLQKEKGRKQALGVFSSNVAYECITISDLEALHQVISSCGYTILGKGTLEGKKQYLANGLNRDLALSVEKSSLISLLRPLSEGIYQSSWKAKGEELTIRFQNIMATLNEEIARQDRQAEELRRIEAEKAGQAEEAKRIQAEKDKKVEQDRRVFAEQKIGTLQNQVASLQWQVNNMQNDDDDCVIS